MELFSSSPSMLLHPCVCYDSRRLPTAHCPLPTQAAVTATKNVFGFRLFVPSGSEAVSVDIHLQPCMVSLSTANDVHKSESSRHSTLIHTSIYLLSTKPYTW